MNPDFEKGSGLVPAVVVDAVTGRVRMVGYQDREAFEATGETGLLHLHSRSRGRLWKKGESSGNLHPVRAMALDCDGDALLVAVAPQGPTCHTGDESCFSAGAAGASGAAGALDRLGRTVRARRGSDPRESYTARLLAAGLPKVAQKVGEEAAEVVVAALAETPQRLAEESADLLYHLTVLWEARGLTLEDVLRVLDGRAGGRP